MSESQIAQDVIAAIGGASNVIASAKCMTRLRLTLHDASLADSEALASIRGVLGSVPRGARGLEVVFGPSVIDGVYSSFKQIVVNSKDEETPLERPEGSMRVLISPARKRSYAAQADANSRRLALNGEDEAGIRALAELLGDTTPKPAANTPGAAIPPHIATEKDHETDDSAKTSAPDAGPRLLVVNGPNINMVGIREPGIYGTKTYADIVSTCKETAAREGFSECVVYQSNHEGDLVDKIQEAYRAFDGIVINPGAYTHTSIAILDALKAVAVPAIEVHISAVESREDFRQVSYVRLACFETITGEGIDGYAHAVRDMARHLELL